MELEVGGKYELKNGDVVQCVKGPDKDGDFEMENGCWYERNGAYWGWNENHAKSVKRRIDTPETGTLQELNVKAGDVLVCIERGDDLYVYPHDLSEPHAISDRGRWLEMSPDRCRGKFRIISRAPETPKIWRDMTREEKGALLLAHHEGKVIEAFISDGNFKYPYDYDEGAPITTSQALHVYHACNDNIPLWQENVAYRVRPEPVREVVTSYWCKKWGMRLSNPTHDTTHRITFETVDGKPDPATIKLEEF